jgi:eukaryotic-like serine/threonine-protein kinase
MQAHMRSLLDALSSFWPERTLDDADRQAVADELDGYNHRVMRILAAVAALINVANIVVYSTLTSENPAYRDWIDNVIRIHLVALVLAPLFVVTRRSAAPGALFYVLFGALLSANAQRAHGAVHAFSITALGSAVLVRTRPWQFILTLLAGCVLVSVAAFRLQPDPTLASASAITSAGVGAVALAAFLVTHVAKMRELIARRALERINAELEQRVERGVREKVKERSEALTRALQRLGDQVSLAPGTVLGERFEIDRPLGFGGMGVVYRGRDLSTRDSVAIKVIQATNAHELDGVHRFLQEAKATASVNHPAVVRSLYIDVTDDGCLYQVMELVEGVPLDERLRRDQALGWGAAARLGVVLGEALAAAHSVGIVHRDVKPPNIMLMRVAPGLKLLDFGVSKLRDDVMAPSETGSRLIGTPEFMAPEQISDSSTVGEKADVYALGLVVYQAAAGRGPFDVTSPAQWLHAHTVRDPIDLRGRVPDCPAPFSEMVMRCLRKDPLARPTAGEVARILLPLADAAQVPSLESLERAKKPRSSVAQVMESAATVDAPPKKD